MQKGYARSILITIAFTLLGLILAMGVFLLVWSLGFPKSFGDFAYNLGGQKVAMDMYYRQYKKDGDIFYCYKALNLSIKLSDNEKTVDYYEKFISDDEVIDFLSALKKHNEERVIGVLEKSAILNDLDFLTSKYIGAVANVKNIDTAWDLAVTEFSKISKTNLKEQGVYAFGEFDITDYADKFNATYDSLGGTLLDSMVSYFDSAVTLFNESKSATDNTTRAYTVALGRRIIQVGNDAKTLLSLSSGNESIVETIVNTMVAVNEDIKGLI